MVKSWPGSVCMSIDNFIRVKNEIIIINGYVHCSCTVQGVCVCVCVYTSCIATLIEDYKMISDWW